MSVFGLMADEVAYRTAAYLRRRAKKSGARQMIVPIDDEIGQRIFATGFFERRESDALKKSVFNKVENNSIAIDVGANIGYYSVLFSTIFSEVLSVEPHPTTCRILTANLAINAAHNVHVVQKGASSTTKFAELQVPHNGNLGWSSLNRWDVPGGSSQVAIELDRLDEIYRQSPVFEKKVGFIKIDVEGHESDVISGATSIIEKNQPLVFFEVNSKNAGVTCCELLESLGYKTFEIFRRKMLGRIVSEKFRPVDYQMGGMVLASF